MEPMLRRLLDENVQLVIRLGQPLGKVRVDPGEVEQVILNLAVNGRDAMPDGGRLTIETSNVTLNADFARDHLDVQPGHYVRLAIADSGTGMSKSTLEHLFEPFFTTKEAGKGTGLGLSTVYGIVRQCGGYVWVDSEERRGTTFQIHFPLAVGPEGTPAARSAVHSSAGGQETILMVEDEDAVRDLLHTVLAQSGYRVLPTRDAAEAMRTAEQHGLAIQLLLTDMVMPGMTGLELAQRLRSVRPGLKVLLLSGYTEQPPLTDKDDTHHTQFLQKPVLPDLLLREVRVLLDS
jgi:CheY-like chemotaxis protein